MIHLGRLLRESCVPLLVILCAILALTWVFDGMAERWSERPVVVRITPGQTGWDPDSVAEDGFGNQEPRVADLADERTSPVVQQARAAAAAGKRDEALRILEQSAEGPDAPADALSELGAQLLKVGRDHDAVQWLNAAVDREPNRFCCKLAMTSGPA